MNKIVLLLLPFLILNSCTEKKENMITQNHQINQENFVAEVEKNIKHYPSEKVYKLSYSSSYAFFEFFVNEFPLEAGSGFEEHSEGSAKEINPFIFENGKQTIKYKMYPVGKVGNDNYTTLLENSYLEIYLRSYDKQNKEAKDMTYSFYKTPMDTVKISDMYSEQKFVGAGKTYYEGIFQVETSVPYKLSKPFANGKDLRKIDKKELESKVFEYYKRVKQILEQKDLDNVARLLYDKVSNEFVSNYASKKSISEVWSDITKTVNDKTFKMQPLENYEMEYFADGKLVALISKSKETYLRGNSALWAKYSDEDGDLSAYTFKIYLYIPEGETEFKVY